MMSPYVCPKCSAGLPWRPHKPGPWICPACGPLCQPPILAWENPRNFGGSARPAGVFRLVTGRDVWAAALGLLVWTAFLLCCRH